MPFLDHLEELRGRLFWMIGALFVGTGFGFWATSYFELIDLLSRQAGGLVYTHPIDPIQSYMTLSIVVGIMLASPVIFYQLWGFVVPALHANEKRVVRRVLAGGLVLFLMGASLAYFFVAPATLRLSAKLAGKSVTQMLTIGEYFSFITTLVLTFGVAFELPLVIMALAALGLVTPSFLRQYRRHAIVLCVVGASFITPGDAVTATVALVGPLYLLYELGIFLARVAQKWRERREAASDDTSADVDDDMAGAPKSLA
jgi:sec-independent protein translocase protein TatC